MQIQVVIDDLDVANANSANLRAAISAALLFLPSEFTEVYFLFIELIIFGIKTTEMIEAYFLQEDLYSMVCSLSYMGDLRMLFAEDKNKVDHPRYKFQFRDVMKFSLHMTFLTFILQGIRGKHVINWCNFFPQGRKVHHVCLKLTPKFFYFLSDPG